MKVIVLDRANAYYGRHADVVGRTTLAGVDILSCRVGNVGFPLRATEAEEVAQ